MNNTETNNLEKENEELKAQIRALSTLNPALYTGVVDDSDEIDLKELWNAIWEGKLLIIGITFLFSVASAFYALSLPDEYRSTALLAPASSSSSSQLGKLAGQFGGLASLAGINIGGGGSEDKTLIAIEIMKTWGFLEKFIRDNNLEVEVFAAEGWNRSSNQLEINTEIYDTTNNKWGVEFDPSKGGKEKPTSWQLYQKLKNRISISQDKTNGLISLSVEYYSPFIAKLWVDKLIKAINADIQAKDRAEATKNIEYLSVKTKETNISDMQSVFYQLIEEQTKTLMLAEVSDEYVFKTLSSAKVAEEKVKPKRALIVLLGIVLGGILSMIIVLVRHFRSRIES
jgi:uncharacterized protein involved in exopolysaccharide biosynthesis